VLRRANGYGKTVQAASDLLLSKEEMSSQVQTFKGVGMSQKTNANVTGVLNQEKYHKLRGE
jgi:hypothetical protein